MVTVQIIILAVLILFSAIFSGTETALMSINQIKAKSLAKQGRSGSAPLLRLKEDPHTLIITILIGNNLVNIGAASLATVVFTNLFGSAGVGIATGIMTFLILVFGEITPKTLAAQNAERISLIIARPLEILSYILWPFVKFFGLISKAVTKIFGSETEKISEEEITTIVSMGKEEGILSKDTARMMSNLLRFEGTRITQIMTPRIDMSILNGKQKLKQVLDLVIKNGHSKFPVYVNKKNNIVGILDVDDVLKNVKAGKINKMVKSMIRPTFFVPETKEIDDLLAEFGEKNIPIAMVVDEYGAIAGLVTVEDILEEIVGSIFKKDTIKAKDRKQISIDAKLSIKQVNQYFPLELDESKFNTIAGYIEHKLQGIPKKGEKIDLNNIVIIVDKVTKTGIKRVKIKKKKGFFESI